MTVEELLEKAAACLNCGKVHELRKVREYQWTWASSVDGHSYHPTIQPEIIHILRELAK